MIALAVLLALLVGALTGAWLHRRYTRGVLVTGFDSMTRTIDAAAAREAALREFVTERLNDAKSLAESRVNDAVVIARVAQEAANTLLAAARVEQSSAAALARVEVALQSSTGAMNAVASAAGDLERSQTIVISALHRFGALDSGDRDDFRQVGQPARGDRTPPPLEAEGDPLGAIVR